MSTDLSRTCIDCQSLFVLEEGEQQFFEARSLPLPRRCADCRRRRKSTQPQSAARSGPIREYGNENGAAAGPIPTRRRERPIGEPGATDAQGARRPKARPRWEITCQECGRADTVPFEPKAGLPIYCRDCHHAKRAVTAQDDSRSATFPSDTAVDYSPRPSSGADHGSDPDEG